MSERQKGGSSTHSWRYRRGVMNAALGSVMAGGSLVSVCCGGGPTPPVRLEVGSENCTNCRMVVSQPGFAAQIVAPGEEARFFDDIGCLANFLTAAGSQPRGAAVAYVADHRTREWVPAHQATYTTAEAVQTPMNSHIIAHADLASRDADPEAKGGASLSPADVFGSAGPPGGSR